MSSPPVPKDPSVPTEPPVPAENAEGFDPRLALVSELIAQEELEQAAKVCVELGDIKQALNLLERGAHFEQAARVALQAGFTERALKSAAMADSSELLFEAAVRMGSQAKRVATDLQARRKWRAAAVVWMGIEEFFQAGKAWEQLEAWREAGLAYERALAVKEAAICFRKALELQPTDGASALALGRLMASRGRWEAAARVLQQVAEDAEESAQAKALLATVLEQLGLHEARASLGETSQVSLPVVVPDSDNVLLGRYEVLRNVCSTPTAHVMEAQDRFTSSRVAVKLFRMNNDSAVGRDALLRFEREVQALNHLRHPNIVRHLAYHVEGPLVILPWLAGGSLRDKLQEEPLSPARAMEIVRSLLHALSEAHRVGIVHRDIKPENILFDEVGSPFLSDFGTAHVSDSSATMTAGLFGSLSYMAPEQLDGTPATVRSDIYSVGAIFYEMLTHRAPTPRDRLSVYPSDNYQELTDEHDDVVFQLLERDPALRPESCDQALEQLLSLTWSSVAERRAPPSSRPPPMLHAERLEPLDTTRFLDRYLQRIVRIVELDPERLALARAFAGVGGDVVACVYRVSPLEQTLWLEEPVGDSLEELDRWLTSEEQQQLRTTLDELHQRGAVHGNVDRDHIRWHSQQGIRLCFPNQVSETATAEDDRAALEALSGKKSLFVNKLC
jgi:eukaryotic-like serine/threonine-protein kinase